MGTRHIYWRYIPRSTDNNNWRLYDGSNYHSITIDADTADTTRWSNIYALASKLEDAIQAVGGALATATVTGNMTTGLLTITGGTGLIAPAPSTLAQKAFDVLIGGDESTGTPVSAYTFSLQHQYGLYLNAQNASDYGDISESVMDSGSRLDGSTSVHKWGERVTRELRYEYLTDTQWTQYQLVLATPSAVAFEDDESAAWGDIAENYSILTSTPTLDRVAPGLEFYHVDIELGVL